ncbi:MAG: MotA/TolQ/ExbB proton channel family protein [Alphaproteobacteria bacterium]|nr:MotA/TolQ/ExbB proton channel family protein [Alphaproteobacteria bacterium]
MNPWTLVGMLGGLILLLGSIALTAKDPWIFINLPGIIVVLGGTIAATLMSYTPKELATAFAAILTTLKSERRYSVDDIDEIVKIAEIWRKGDLRGAETEIKNANSPFLSTAMSLVLDGTPTKDIVEMLEWRIGQMKQREKAEANLFRTMATYAPAFGMVGTLLGLVNMLYEMGQGNMDSLGLNLAVALITTFYGVVLANAILKPIAVKLERRTQDRENILRMVIQSVVMMNEQRKPSYIRETMKGFSRQVRDEIGAPPPANSHRIAPG